MRACMRVCVHACVRACMGVKCIILTAVFACGRYYQDIMTVPAISDQDMNAMLAEESRVCP